MPRLHLPPELWERIITGFIAPHSTHWEDELPSPTAIKDLKSCSVVSEALLFPAQSVLFRRIDVDLGTLVSRHRVLARRHRLAAIFEKSPHLAAHVQRLSARLDVEIFTLISRMGLSRLPDIDIVRRGLLGGDMNGPLREVVQAVVGEGIRHLRFTEFYSLSYAAVIPILKKPHIWKGFISTCAPLETVHLRPIYRPRRERGLRSTTPRVLQNGSFTLVFLSISPVSSTPISQGFQT
ncbi:hypothetical protein C8R44DRAFT_871428 [Mycena epipterygia]|nr:hypothetical protein C8R44DRAFT_871428 [Mycena epipterygia]